TAGTLRGGGAQDTRTDEQRAFGAAARVVDPARFARVGRTVAPARAVGFPSGYSRKCLAAGRTISAECRGIRQNRNGEGAESSNAGKLAPASGTDSEAGGRPGAPGALSGFADDRAVRTFECTGCLAQDSAPGSSVSMVSGGGAELGAHRGGKVVSQPDGGTGFYQRDDAG